MAAITLYTKNILEDADGVVVDIGEDSGFPAARLYDRAVSLYWKKTTTNAITITIDQGASGNLAVDFLAVFRHNFSGEDMQWQWSTDNFSADINDAVTDWAQSDNLQIIKTLGSALTKRYWRVTITSMTDPKCGEIWMGEGLTLDVLGNPAPAKTPLKNVQWNKTVGGLARSTKFGDSRRAFAYDMFLSAANLTLFEAAMDDLDHYSLPFYITDHEGNTYLAKTDGPVFDYANKASTRVQFPVEELL